MSEYEPDEEKRGLSDDIQDTADSFRTLNNIRKKANDFRDKLDSLKNNPSKQTGSGGAQTAQGNPGQSAGNGEQSAGNTGQPSGGAAQAGGDAAANTSASSATGGDAAAGASGSGAAANETLGVSAGAEGAAGAGGGAAGGGAAAGGAAAGGAAAGGAAAGGAAAGGAAAGGAAAGGAAAGAGAAAAAPAIGIGCLVVLAVMALIFILIVLVYIITLPVNVLSYSADAVGEGITSWAENVGQDLSVAKYNFMIDMYDMSSSVEDFAFHVLHPGQAAATDAILAELDKSGISLANDEFAPEYTDTTNSIVVTLDGAFRKGWARTAQTAEYRANQIVSQSSLLGDKQSVVDKYDNEELWNSNDYWNNTSNWKKGDDYYIAGTFTNAPGETYKNECTDDKVSISTSIVPDIDGDGIPDTEDDDVSQPCYMDAIMKVIALQNCAEQTIILNDNKDGDIKQYGVDATYSDDSLLGDSNSSAEAKMKSTEYQLLRLAGEIAGRGIQRQDLNTSKEQENIYQIVTTTEIKETPTTHDVQIKYKSGTHEEATLDENGDRQYDDEGNLITHTVDDYSWKHDHYEVCVHVTVQTTYSVVLRADAKDIIANEMAKTLSDEEKQAYYDAIDGYYDMQYELLCQLYNLNMNNGGGSIVGGGGYQPGMTPEEIEALLGSLNLDPASARGQLVQIALASCGKYTYNQSNGFRDGVNAGLYSPGNVNYTGTQFDCSSFVQYCYFMAGIPLSPTNTNGYASAIASGELIEITADQVQPGDLQVVYPTGSYEGHVWMYVGDGNWCECTPKGGVRADNWSKNFMTTHPSHYVRSVFLQGG